MMGIARIEGSFAGTGQSPAIAIRGKFNFSLAGFGAATVRLERSFDAGANWRVVSKPDLTAASFTGDVDGVGEEPEIGVVYRFSCTSYTSGTIAYRISQ